MARRRSYLALFAIGTMLAVPVAGCGGDDDNGGESAQTAPATTPTAPSGGAGGETVDMSLTDFALNPANPTVKPGNVTFDVTNGGQTTHALEVEGPGEEVETDDLAPGDSAKLTVELSKPGTYEMYCPVGNHRDLGMEGEITVK